MPPELHPESFPGDNKALPDQTHIFHNLILESYTQGLKSLPSGRPILYRAAALHISGHYILQSRQTSCHDTLQHTQQTVNTGTKQILEEVPISSLLMWCQGTNAKCSMYECPPSSHLEMQT